MREPLWMFIFEIPRFVSGGVETDTFIAVDLIPEGGAKVLLIRYNISLSLNNIYVWSVRLTICLLFASLHDEAIIGRVGLHWAKSEGVPELPSFQIVKTIIE